MESLAVEPRQLATHYREVKARLNKGRLIVHVPIVIDDMPVPIQIQLIEPPVPKQPTRYPTVAEILAVVARHFDVETAAICSTQPRTADIVIPRHVVMYLSKNLTTRSLPFIGRAMGGRDHTTVMHGVRRITSLLPKKIELAHSVAELEGRLRKKFAMGPQ